MPKVYDSICSGHRSFAGLRFFSSEQFQDLIEGMKNAAFTLPKPIDQELNQLFEL